MSKKSLVFTSISAFFTTLIILLIFLPYLLSQPFFYPVSKRFLSGVFGARVDFEKIDLSWLGQNQIKKPSAIASNWSFQAYQIDTSHGLLRIWWMKDYGKVDMDNPHFEIRIQKATPRKTQKAPFQFYGKLLVHNGKIDLVQSNEELVQFTDIKSEIEHLDQISPWKVNISGNTQDRETSGEFFVSADIPEKNFEDPSFRLNAKIKKVPTEILDVFFLRLLPLEFQSWGEILGNRFSLNLESNIQEGRLFLDTGLISPFVLLQSKFFVTKEQIYSENESLLQVTLNETSLNHLHQNLGLHLPFLKERNLFTRITLQSFTLPRSKEDILWKESSFGGEIRGRSQGVLRLEGETKNYDFLLENTNFSTANLAQSLQVNGLAELKVEEEELSKAEFSTQLLNLFEHVQLNQPRIRLSNFPVIFLNQIFDYPLKAIIGSTLNLRVDVEKNDFAVKIFSNRGVIGPARFNWVDGLHLQETMPFSWRFRSFQPIPGFNIANSFEIQGSIEEFHSSHHEILQLNLDAQSSNIQLSSIIGNCFFPNPSGSLTWDLNGQQVRIDGAVQTKDQGSLLSLLFGENTRLISRFSRKKSETPTLFVESSGETLEGKASFEINSGKVQLEDTSQIRFSPQASLLNGYLRANNIVIPWVQTRPIMDVELKELSIPISQENSFEVDLFCKTQNDQLLFVMDREKEALKYLEMRLKQKEEFEVELSVATLDEARSKIKIREEDQDFYLEASLNQLPSSLIESFFQNSLPLKELVGAEISGSFRLESNPQKRLLFCDCYADKAGLSFGYQSDKESAFLTKPFELEGKLDFTAFQAIFPEFAQEYSLKRPTYLSLKIDKYQGKALFQNTFSFLDFFNGVSRGSLTFKDFQIENNRDQFIHLNTAEMNWQKKRANAPLEMDLLAQVDSGAKNYSLPGNVQAELILDQWLNAQSQIAWNSLSCTGIIRIKNVPTSLIDLYYSGEDSIPPSTLFGRLLSANVDIQIQKSEGNFSSDINSSDFHGALDGYLQNGFLTLKKPLKAYWTISPQVSELLLENMDIDYISAKKPIELTISPNGFRFPLHNFNIRNATIRQGQLNLGQLRCYNRGSPQDVSSLFELNLAASNVISLWFAPMDFQMQSGLLEIERTEILFDNRYEIAVWGLVNLINRQVKMNLGLTAQSLREALGITNLPDDYVLRIPFKGTIGNVRIDRATAAAKIALLVARQTGQSSDSVWGGFIGAIGELADDQSSIPPAKHPFPWER